jgi:hypothetical protein
MPGGKAKINDLGAFIEGDDGNGVQEHLVLKYI